MSAGHLIGVALGEVTVQFSWDSRFWTLLHWPVVPQESRAARTDLAMGWSDSCSFGSSASELHLSLLFGRISPRALPRQLSEEIMEPSVYVGQLGCLQEGVFICSGRAAYVKETEVMRVLYRT